MEAAIREYAKCLEGTIDYVGQKKAENTMDKILQFSMVCGFVVGVMFQNIHYTVYVFGLGIVVSFLLVIPPYKMYNQNNLQWLPSPSVDVGSVDFAAGSAGDAAQVVIASKDETNKQ